MRVTRVHVWRVYERKQNKKLLEYCFGGRSLLYSNYKEIFICKRSNGTYGFEADKNVFIHDISSNTREIH